MNQQSHDRRGSMLTEMIVAAGLLGTAMGLVMTCAVASQRLQRLQREHTLAVDELSNQLERFIALPASELDNGLQQLAPSEWIAQRLPEPKLTAERHRDELGDRIELQLQWQRVGNPPPVVAVGWLDASEQTTE